VRRDKTRKANFLDIRWLRLKKSFTYGNFI
jgi:hypothetical protein